MTTDPLTIEFKKKGKLSPEQQLHEFFELNPKYRMTDYEPITGGIRAYYEIVQ